MFDRMMRNGVLGALLMCTSICVWAPGEAQAQKIGPLQHATAQLQPPKPPYYFEARTLSMVYQIPKHRVAHLVPAGLQLVSMLGSTPLMVMYNKYSLAQSISSGITTNGFLEVGYGLVVRGPKGLGTFPIKLHLNDRVAVQAGVQYYGYPKVLAALDYAGGSTRFYMRSRTLTGSLLDEIDVEKRKLGGDGSGPFATWVRQLMSGMLPITYFNRGGQLLWATFTMSAAGASRVRIRRVTHTYLESAGILPRWQWASPVYARLMDDIRMRLGTPQPVN